MSLKVDDPLGPRRRSVPLAWVVALVIVAAGVGIGLSAALNPTPAAPAGPNSVTLTDDLGRNVTVPYDPSRVVVLSPSIMDTLYRLGLRSHVVGVDCYAPALGGLADDYSPDQIQLWNLSSSMCVTVGPTFAPQTLAELAPQLVLASTIVSIAAVEQITSNLGVPVVMLQPPSVSGIVVDDSLVGEIFGVAAQADALNAQLQAELYRATNVTSSASAFPSVLLTYSVDANGYWTFGPGTFGESLLEFAGAVGLGANASFEYPELSPAQILSGQPNWIVYGTGFGITNSTYASGPDWSSFAAVQTGHVYGIDSNWVTEPDPTMLLDGLPALLALFHPSP